MLTATEKKNLKNLLAMAEEPDDTFSYDELLGYMFGLAMTPDYDCSQRMDAGYFWR